MASEAFHGRGEMRLSAVDYPRSFNSLDIDRRETMWS